MATLAPERDLSFDIEEWPQFRESEPCTILINGARCGVTAKWWVYCRCSWCKVGTSSYLCGLHKSMVDDGWASIHFIPCTLFFDAYAHAVAAERIAT